jgi:MoaA/NifB/PqqE/SkfB family radical SAM enzyme
LLGESKLKEFKELPYELVKKMIEDLHDGGVKEIMLSGGGEPFMHPRIMDIIELIKKRGIKLNIITNFTLLDKEKIKKIVELNVDYITASIWAGDAETYVKTHPNQNKKTFRNIKKNLKYLYSIKKGNNLPYVKIYNVISKFNYNKISKMFDFALETLVDYIEFQVIDIIPGKTDSLRLDERDKINIKKQILNLKNRKDYFDEFIETKGLEKFDKKKHKEELISFGKFYNVMDKGFRIIAGGKFAVCPKGYLSINRFINDIPEKLCFFEFPSEICSKCLNTLNCYPHRKAIPLKVKLLKFMGGGTFTRRISNQNEKGNYDSNIIDSVPCYVGWIYARILTNGDITPCCKAHLFPLGNLHKKSFKEIWFSKKYDEFRKKAKKLKKSDKYFSKIGCYKGCDNLGMNLEMHRRMKDLSLFEKIRVLIKK